jgi:hypothetical protein
LIRLNPRPILQVLLAVNVLLVGGFIFFRHVPLSLRSITRMFDVTAEASVPAWYSSMLLAGIGLLALLRGLTLRSAGRAAGWSLHVALGAGFFFLSADEVGQIHESISGGLHKHLDAGAATSNDASAWDVVTFGFYFAVAAAVLLTFGRQAINLFLHSPGRWSIIAGGVLFAVGATVVDQFQSAVPFGLGSALEDGCELFGASIMLHGFLVNLGRVTVSSAPAPAPVAATVHSAVTVTLPGRRPLPERRPDRDLDEEAALPRT